MQSHADKHSSITITNSTIAYNNGGGMTFFSVECIYSNEIKLHIASNY